MEGVRRMVVYKGVAIWPSSCQDPLLMNRVMVRLQNVNQRSAMGGENFKRETVHIRFDENIENYK